MCVSSCTFSSVWQVLNCSSFLQYWFQLYNCPFQVSLTCDWEPLRTDMTFPEALQAESGAWDIIMETIPSMSMWAAVGHSETAQHVSAITTDTGTREQEAHGLPHGPCSCVRWCCGPDHSRCPDWLHSGSRSWFWTLLIGFPLFSQTLLLMVCLRADATQHPSYYRVSTHHQPHP